MEIVIRKLTAGDQGKWKELDDVFIVDSILDLSFVNNQIKYEVKNVPRFEKRYPDKQLDEDGDTNYMKYIDNPDQIIYLARVQEKVIGQIILKRNWNCYAYVEDIKVDRRYRRLGVGRKLIEQAKQWAIAGGMPGIMLETQNNNVNACKFYENCGFSIGGFDRFLYKGVDKMNDDEIAIFWYLMI